MNVDRAAIGRRIREIRIKKKISQETLAEYADIGACGYVSRIELGRALSSLEVYYKIAGALEVPISRILDGAYPEAADYLEPDFARAWQRLDTEQKNSLLLLARSMAQMVEYY
ncbi:MAG: helix-turn-helix domain-containing protein [Oscillospiraceae bacterium]